MVKVGPGTHRGLCCRLLPLPLVEDSRSYEKIHSDEAENDDTCQEAEDRSRRLMTPNLDHHYMTHQDSREEYLDNNTFSSGEIEGDDVLFPNAEMNSYVTGGERVVSIKFKIHTEPINRNYVHEKEQEDIINYANFGDLGQNNQDLDRLR